MLFQFIHHFAGRYALLDDIAIFFAQYLPYLLVLAFLVLVFYQAGRRRQLYLFAEGALAVIFARGIITSAIHFFYYEARPYVVLHFTPLINESGSSFPSAHMAWFFALSMTVWYVNRKWGIWFFVLSALMGIARIYTGVHWPTDIIAGVIIGLASGFFIHWLLRGTREKL